MRAHSIHIDLDPERAYGTRPSSTHKSSMLQDFERDRSPEIDGLLTAVQEFARAMRVATPHLDAITAPVIEKARRMKPRDNVLQGGGAATTDPRKPDYANLYA